MYKNPPLYLADNKKMVEIGIARAQREEKGGESEGGTSGHAKRETFEDKNRINSNKSGSF